MGFKKKEKEPNFLDEEIKRVVEELSQLDPKSAEYEKAVSNLKVLTESKTLNETESKNKVNPNTVITSGCNLLGIGLILGYERLHVIASKALGFVIKPKI